MNQQKFVFNQYLYSQYWINSYSIATNLTSIIYFYLFIFLLYTLNLFYYCKHIFSIYYDCFSKVGNLSWRWPEGYLFNSYYTKVLGKALLHSLNCFTLPLILTLKCWMLSKEASSTIIWVFGMIQPRIKPWSPWPLTNTLLIRPMTLTLA